MGEAEISTDRDIDISKGDSIEEAGKQKGNRRDEKKPIYRTDRDIDIIEKGKNREQTINNKHYLNQ